MKDAEYLFSQTTRERKQLSRNAKYKKNGSKSRRCTLPSDNLTPAQLRRRNGTVLTYNLDQPHTLSELKDWPADLRHEYMTKLIDEYNPNNLGLSLMLGCSETSICYILGKHFGIKRGRGYRTTRDPATQLQWEQFIGVAPELLPEPETEPDPEPMPEPVARKVGPTFEETYIKFTGKAEDLLCVIASGRLRIDTESTYTFTITATRKEN